MTNTSREIVSYYAFLILAFILPILVLPYTIFPVDFNKAFLFYFVVALAAIFWFISILQEAKIRIPKSYILASLAVIILVWLASSIFSSNVSLSMIGMGNETGTLWALVFLSAGLFLASVLFQSEKRTFLFYMLLFASSLLVFTFQLFHTIFNINFFPWDFFQDKFANLIGSWNEISIFFGLTALLSVVFLELCRFSKRLRIFFFVVLISSLIGMIFINFTTTWVVFGILSLIFLVYLFSIFRMSAQAADSSSRKFVSLTIFILMITIFFILARVLIGDFVSSLGINNIEVRPSWASTFQTIKGSLKENPLLGSGPNTFLYDWLKFKPVDINLTLFWAYPFQAGIGLLVSLLAATGILGGFAWLVFFVFLLFYGLKAITYSENEIIRSLLIASFLGAVYLWIFSAVYTVGFLLFALAFLITGIFIATLCLSGRVKIFELSFSQNAKLGFVCSLVVVLLMIASVASFYFLSQKYWAAYSFGRGISILNSGGNIDEAESLISRASRFDRQDRYYRALSEIGLLRLQQLVSKTNVPEEDLRTQFQNIVASAIGNAQTACVINPLDFLNWMDLGQIYEALIPFKIPGATNAAINAYKEAAVNAPFDPRPLFNSARVEIQANNLDLAKSFLNSSLAIKSDYAPSLFLLSQLEAQQGNLREAIMRTEQVRILAPNDIGVLFQLGLLYYQSKDFESARLVLERAVSLSSNYSNARYFLGLIYDKQGRAADAIAQFEQIKILNPDNEEVKTILSNLYAGKGALAGISPPQPSPEKRPTPPLSETGAGENQ